MCVHTGRKPHGVNGRISQRHLLVDFKGLAADEEFLVLGTWQRMNGVLP